MPIATSVFADRSAPHPNPLPAKSGARERTYFAATTLSPTGRPANSACKVVSVE